MKFSGEQLVYGPGHRKYGWLFWAHISRYLHAIESLEAWDVAKERKVLDAACGSGYGTYLLSQSSTECAGIDINDEAIQYAHKNFSKNNCSFIAGSVTELPFPSDTLDCVISFETIEHLSHVQQQKFFREINRVLRSGGLMIMSTPVANGATQNPFHLHELTRNEFLAMAEPFFSRLVEYGQFLVGTSTQAGSRDIVGIDSNDCGASSGGHPSIGRRVLQASASNVRSMVDLCFGRYYLRHPRLLRAVSQSFYRRYRVVPANTEHYGFVILHGIK
jgi:SAM-dependent methyltransferase